MREPWSNPKGILDRLIYPSLNMAYNKGVEDAHAEQNQLQALGFTTEELDELIFAALELAKLGIRTEDAPEMARYYLRCKALGISLADLMEIARNKI